jgi:hypothetical protein
MIDPAEILDLLQKAPFRAFRIYMSDGYVTDVTEPGLVATMDNGLFIALRDESWVLLSYQQMTRLESTELTAS